MSFPIFKCVICGAEVTKPKSYAYKEGRACRIHQEVLNVKQKEQEKVVEIQLKAREIEFYKQWNTKWEDACKSVAAELLAIRVEVKNINNVAAEASLQIAWETKIILDRLVDVAMLGMHIGIPPVSANRMLEIKSKRFDFLMTHIIMGTNEIWAKMVMELCVHTAQASVKEPINLSKVMDAVVLAMTGKEGERTAKIIRCFNQFLLFEALTETLAKFPDICKTRLIFTRI